MTRLSTRKSRLQFTTDNILNGREIVVEPEPLVCVVRLKGSRTRYSVAWTTVFYKAAEIAAAKLREERKAARLARRKARA